MMNNNVALPRGVKILGRGLWRRFGDSLSSVAAQLSRIKVFLKSQESILVCVWHLEKSQTKPIAVRPSPSQSRDHQEWMIGHV
jgi:hypothetical protein